MSCAYHQEQPVQGICSTCGRPICADCLVELGGQAHCKMCLRASMARPAREINSFMRFVLSAVPGVGHMYMGLMQRGFQLLAGGIGLAIVLGMVFSPILGLYIPALICFSIFDAREAHLRLAQGLEVEDKGFFAVDQLPLMWNAKYIGYGLIAFGALALWNIFLSDILRFVIPDLYRMGRIQASIRQITLSLVAIGAGIWLLRRRARKSL
jgi:hypothetical protein